MFVCVFLALGLFVAAPAPAPAQPAATPGKADLAITKGDIADTVVARIICRRIRVCKPGVCRTIRRYRRAL